MLAEGHRVDSAQPLKSAVKFDQLLIVWAASETNQLRRAAHVLLGYTPSYSRFSQVPPDFDPRRWEDHSTSEEESEHTPSPSAPPPEMFTVPRISSSDMEAASSRRRASSSAAPTPPAPAVQQTPPPPPIPRPRPSGGSVIPPRVRAPTPAAPIRQVPPGTQQQGTRRARDPEDPEDRRQSSERRQRRRQEAPETSDHATWVARAETSSGRLVLDSDSILANREVAVAVAGTLNFDADMAINEAQSDSSLLFTALQSDLVVSPFPSRNPHSLAISLTFLLSRPANEWELL